MGGREHQNIMAKRIGAVGPINLLAWSSLVACARSWCCRACSMGPRARADRAITDVAHTGGSGFDRLPRRAVHVDRLRGLEPAESYTQSSEQETRAYQIIIESIPPARERLEAQFRQLLGVARDQS